MGEARKRQTRNEILIKQHPFCVYCGGQTAATEVDHVPPISVFTLRRRPEGLEFATCHACHTGTRKLDLIASFYARIGPEKDNAHAEAEMVKIAASMKRNLPDIAEEWERLVPQTGAYSLTEEATKAYGEGMPLRIFGPIARSYFNKFAARVGLALHYEFTKNPLPQTGSIFVRAFTNTALLRGDLPDRFFKDIGQFQALYQKGLEAEKDFAFAGTLGRDSSETMTFFRFRQSMGAVVFCFANPPDSFGPGLTRFQPGFLIQPSD